VIITGDGRAYCSVLAGPGGSGVLEDTERQ
jgi:hypothetical protein